MSNRGGYSSRGGDNFAPRGGYSSRGGDNFAPRGGYSSRGGDNFAPRGARGSGGPRYSSNQPRGAYGSAPSRPLVAAGKIGSFDQYHNVEIAADKENQQLLINLYDIQPSSRQVYFYELRFFCEGRTQRDLSVAPDRSVEANIHREKISALYYHLLDQKAALFQTNLVKDDIYDHVYAYDRSLNFFCSVKIETGDAGQSFDIIQEGMDYAFRRDLGRPNRIFATLKMIKPVLADDEITTALYLDVLFSQHQLDGHVRFAKFGPKFYDLNSSRDLTGGAELKDGHQKTVRATKTTAKLQIDAKISPFRCVMLLHEYVYQKWGYGPNDNWLSDKIHQTLLELRGLFVRTTHKTNNEVFRIRGITNVSADQIFFERQGANISVAAYFRDAYQKQLEYPKLPCALKKIRDREMHYPLECLEIFKGQRLPKDGMNKQQEKNMVETAARLPLDLIGEIENQMGVASIRDNDPYIRTAQVQISTAMNSVAAEVLQAPLITYKDDAPKQVVLAQWDIRDVQFVSPAEINALAIFFEVRCVPKARADEVAGKIALQASRLGMKIHSWKCFPLEEYQRTREYLEGTIAEFRDQFYCDFVMAFVGGSEFHHILKATEVVTKVPTQQVEPKTVNNPKLGAVTLGNIIQKMNPKNGGRNQYFRQAIPSQIAGENIDLLRSFMEDTMVIGFCLSHPPTGMEGHPSICGYSFSTTKRGNVTRGGFVYTKARETILSAADLRKPLENAVKLYAEENQNCFPKRVLVYRFGTSDGEARRVYNEECHSMLETLTAAMGGNEPKLYVVIAYRQHNTRVFKQKGEIDTRGRAPEQNVLPGSCTAGATEGDIVMVPHLALKGTAKPTIFSTIYPTSDVNDLSVNFLKNITHSFCYMHEIVDSPISVPHVLRSADQLATRGKNLWHSKSRELPVIANVEEFLSHATTIFNPEIPTRYWA